MNVKEIRSLNDDSSRYSVRVVFPGQQGRLGLLTYDLLSPDLGRSTVLLSAEVMRGLLSPDQRSALDTLTGYLNDAQKLNAHGRMAQAKSLVRRIASGEINYPGKAIMVHRFGAVPALAIDTDQTMTLPGGEEIKLRLGLYLGSDKNPTGSKLPAGSPSTVHFLESLKVQTAVLFTRYFEDIGEMLFAIQYKADLANALAWGRHVETVLAESVKSKLRAILPETETGGGRKREIERELAESVRTDHAAVILQAQYARLLVLYLLNDLYELLGIRSKKNKYREQLLAFDTENKRWFASNVIQDAKRHDEGLHDLEKVFEKFDACAKSQSLNDLPSVQSSIAWVKQVSDFARFLAVLRKRGASEAAQSDEILDPRYVRIFFSSIHLVPTGVHVFQMLKANVQETGRNILLLSVQEPADTRFRELILARLWLSDAVLALLPRPDRFDGSLAGYAWIGKESALALLTNTDVSFAVEKGVEPVQIANEFSRIDTDLFPWADRSHAVDRLLNHFNGAVHGKYEMTDPSRPLDDRLADQLTQLVERARVERTDKLVKGFLDQFPPEFLVHAEILERAGNGVQGSWMAHLLREAQRVRFAPEDNEETRKEKARAKFARLFEIANGRALVLDGSDYPLMTSEWENKKRKRYKIYSWRLRSILRELRPWCNDEELRKWEIELLKRSVTRAQETMRRRQPDLGSAVAV